MVYQQALPVKKNNDDRSAWKIGVCSVLVPGEKVRESAALCLQASEEPEQNPKWVTARAGNPQPSSKIIKLLMTWAITPTELT